MREIEIKTADIWYKQGTIKVTDIGEENSYYIDKFNNTYYCKNYPWGFINGILQTSS